MSNEISLNIEKTTDSGKAILKVHITKGSTPLGANSEIIEFSLDQNSFESAVSSNAFMQKTDAGSILLSIPCTDSNRKCKISITPSGDVELLEIGNNDKISISTAGKITISCKDSRSELTVRADSITTSRPFSADKVTFESNVPIVHIPAKYPQKS